MKRRALLGFVAVLSGCGESDGNARASGDDTSPDDGTTPARATEAPNAAGRALRIENRTDSEQFVTVVVRDGDEVLVSESRELRPRVNGTIADFVRRPGVHDVVVETAGGQRRTGQWVVHENWPEPYEVTVTADGVRLRQTTTCDPDCPPLGVDGEAPERSLGPGPRNASLGGTLFLRNTAAESRRVAVDVAAAATDGDERTLLSYRYDVPARVGFAVPVAGGPGVYPTRVAVGDAERRFRWHVPETQTLRVDVGGGISSWCPPGAATRTELTAENLDDEAHDVVVRATVDGDARDELRFWLSAESASSLAAFDARETLTLEAATDADESLSARWVQCPPDEVSLRIEAGRLLFVSEHTVVASSEAGKLRLCRRQTASSRAANSWVSRQQTQRGGKTPALPEANRLESDPRTQ